MPLNPPPVVADALLLVTQQLSLSAYQSRLSEVTFGLSCADSTLATAQDAIDDFQSNFNTNILPFFNNGVTIEKPTGRMGTGSTTPREVIAAGAAGTGTSTGDICSPAVAILAKKTTALTGKKNRGRTYYPYVALEVKVDPGGHIDNTTVAAYQAGFTAFLAGLVTDATPMCIVNKVYNTPLPPHYVTQVNQGPLVTAYTCEDMVATQRRRQRP